MIIETITLFAIAMVLYHHAGYPMLLKLILRFSHPKPHAHFDIDFEHEAPKDLPSITIIIPAYNEEKYIAEKIRNLACLNYPKDKFEVIIAADGCRDKTVEIAIKTNREYLCRNLRVKIIEFPINRGKVIILNALVPQVKSELVALSDVSSIISIDALSVSAERFMDSTVGGVNGNYRILNPGSQGEARYWEYQRAIQIGEETLGSCLGAHGAFYMIRQRLFERIPKDSVNDDFIIPMNIIAKGYRVVYEPRLNAIELEQASDEQDWHRRLRISFGNAQQVVYLHKLFHPKYRGVAFAFISGKALRLTMPFFMMISLVGSALLMSQPLFLFLAISQTALYLTALGTQFIPSLQKNALLKILHYLVLGHVANFIGGMAFYTGRKLNSWS